MAPRRGARVVKVDHVVDYDNLTVKEVLCPICRSILIEPVTLPCNHVFCSSCFQGTMENANLVCPLCRMRIGSWLRSSKKENKLINMEYWNAIKKLFPDQIKNKLEGIEENLDYETPMIRLAEPGELKKEYEIQYQKETEKIRKEREAESKASENLIRKLKEEEEYRQILEEEKLRLDEEIAKKLAEELNSVNCIDKSKEVQSMQSTSKLNNYSNNLKKIGPLARFIKCKGSINKPYTVKDDQAKKIDLVKKDYTCRILCQDIGSDWDMSTKKTINLTGVNKSINQGVHQVIEIEGNSDSSDSIVSEYRYFKPIDYKHIIPCHKSSPVKVPALRAKVLQMEICAPRGQNLLHRTVGISAFATFSTPITLVEEEEKYTKSSTQIATRRKSASPEKKPSPKRIFSSSPEKKNNNSIVRVEKINQFTSFSKRTNPGQITKFEKVNSPSKRKMSDDNSTRKRIRPSLNDSFSRFLATPSSPFKGFCINREVTNKEVRKSENTKDLESLEKEKIRLQVKADYELARKLQIEFNGVSYSTRSSAPRRGIKVTRQTTLDSVLLKKSYKI